MLQAVYGVDDQDILAVLNDLLLMPVLLFEAQPVLHAFILKTAVEVCGSRSC